MAIRGIYRGQLAIGANGPTNHTGIGPNKGTYRGQLAIGANGSYDPKGHKGPTGHKGQTTSIRHIDFAKEAMLTTLATSRGAPRHMWGGHVNGDAAACNQAGQGTHVNDSAMYIWVSFGPDTDVVQIGSILAFGALFGIEGP